jgi:hypothetical protein
MCSVSILTDNHFLKYITFAWHSEQRGKHHSFFNMLRLA